MSKLFKTRIARLEALAPADNFTVAVATAPFPIDGDQQSWAHALLSNLGWADRELAVWVTEGPLSITLQPIDTNDLEWKAEGVWLDAGRSFPHAIIIARPDGATVNIYASDDDKRAHIADLERELEA